MISCPICKKNTIAEITPVEGYTGFFLSAVNQNVTPHNVDPASGFPVDIYACTSCGNILLRNTKLINQSNEHQ